MYRSKSTDTFGMIKVLVQFFLSNTGKRAKDLKRTKVAIIVQIEPFYLFNGISTEIRQC